MSYEEQNTASLYAQRYSELLFPNFKNWDNFSKKMLAIFPVCCFPGCGRQANNLHHAAYQDSLGVQIGENGILGIHYFPLCRRHHNDDRTDIECAHHPDNWDQGLLPPPRLDAIQRPRYYIMLRNEFKQLYSETKLRVSRLN